MQKYKRLRGKPERAGRGWKLSVSTSPLSSLTGISSRVPQVGLWEPGEGRPSRRVLREPEDAIPRPLTWSRQVMRRVPLAGRYLPVGLAAKLAFDVSTPAFGYQESHTCNDATHEVLPGTPVVRDGYLWPSSSRASPSTSTRRPHPASLRSSSALTAGPPASAAPTGPSSLRELGHGSARS